MASPGGFRPTGSDLQQMERLFARIAELFPVRVEFIGPSGDSLIRIAGDSPESSVSSGWVDRPEKFFRKISKTGRTEEESASDEVDRVVIPLEFHGQSFGHILIGLGSVQESERQGVLALLREVSKGVTDRFSMQLEMDSLVGELSVRYEELSLLYEIGKSLGESGRTEGAVHFILDKTLETLEPDLAVVSISNRGLFEMRMNHPEVLPFPGLFSSHKEKIEGILVKRLATAETDPPHVVLNDIRRDTELSRFFFHAPLNLLAVPVKLKGVITGFLGILRADPERLFQTGDVRLMATLAKQLSIVTTNGELYQNLKDFLLNVIKTLVSSIEAKDAYTRGHSERVRNLCLMMAEGLELEPGEKEVLSWSALLHDIGKLGVPEDILTKPGRLTEDEYTILKEHPERGFRILAPIEQLRDSLDGIRYHHERIDGTGYPFGLKGGEIPLHARIIAVADTYDAMTSRRAYRPQLSDELTIAEMKRVGGTQLDPDIVELFVRLMRGTFLEEQVSAAGVG